MARRRVLLGCVMLVLLGACTGNDLKLPGSDGGPLPSAAAGEEAAFGRFQEPVTLRIGLHIPALDNNPVIPYIEKLTHIQVIHPWEAEGETAYEQKINLAIESRDLPDAMMVSRKQLDTLIEADLIEELTPIYSEYASRQVKEIYASTGGAALAAATRGGKLYALPNVAIEVDYTTLLWLRRDWLEKLKLAPPRTLEDVERILTAFTEGDPDGDGQKNTSGLPGYKLLVYGKKPFIGGFDPVFNSYGAYPKTWIASASGRVVYGSVQPENKAALARLADWYSRGFIDPEFVLNENVETAIVEDRTGSFFGPWWAAYWPLGDFLSLDADADWQAYAVPLQPDGSFRVHREAVSDRFFVVRKGYDHPEAAVKLVNVLIRLERKEDPHTADVDKLEEEAARANVMLHNYYPIDLILDYSNGVTRRYKEMEAVRAGKTKLEELSRETGLLYGKIYQTDKVLRQQPAAWADALAYGSGINTLLAQRLVNTASAFVGTTPAMEDSWEMLAELENETFLNIITGQLPVDAFDEFVSEWKRLGGEKITNEVNEAVSP